MSCALGGGESLWILVDPRVSVEFIGQGSGEKQRVNRKVSFLLSYEAGRLVPRHFLCSFGIIFSFELLTGRTEIGLIYLWKNFLDFWVIYVIFGLSTFIVFCY